MSTATTPDRVYPPGFDWADLDPRPVLVVPKRRNLDWLLFEDGSFWIVKNGRVTRYPNVDAAALRPSRKTDLVRRVAARTARVNA